MLFNGIKINVNKMYDWSKDQKILKILTLPEEIMVTIDLFLQEYWNINYKFVAVPFKWDSTKSKLILKVESINFFIYPPKNRALKMLDNFMLRQSNKTKIFSYNWNKQNSISFSIIDPEKLLIKKD